MQERTRRQPIQDQQPDAPPAEAPAVAIEQPEGPPAEAVVEVPPVADTPPVPLSPEDAALVDGHRELHELTGRQETAKALLADYSTRREAVKALAVDEAAQVDAQRQAEGIRGRRPHGPATKKLRRLEHDRDLAEVDVEALPKVIERVQQRLAADLRVIREVGEPAAERFNAEIVSIAEAAKELGQRISKAIPDAMTAAAVAPKVARSWSYDPELLIDTIGLANVMDSILGFAEHIRQTAYNREPQTVARQAEMRRINDDAREYRLKLIDAENAYKVTGDGRLLWLVIASEIRTTLGQMTSGPVPDAQAFRERTDDRWYRKVCEFAGLEYRPAYCHLDW